MTNRPMPEPLSGNCIRASKYLSGVCFCSKCQQNRTAKLANKSAKESDQPHQEKPR